MLFRLLLALAFLVAFGATPVRAEARPKLLAVVLDQAKVEKLPEDHTIDDYSLPDRLFGTIATHLDARRTLGSVVEVTTPYYVGVSVAALVRAASGRPPTLVRQRLLEMLYRYVNPLTGGPDGEGWPWDTPVTTATLMALAGEVDGVVAVDELVMFDVDLRNGERMGENRDVIRLDGRSLFLGFHHRVVVR